MQRPAPLLLPGLSCGGALKRRQAALAPRADSIVADLILDASLPAVAARALAACPAQVTVAGLSMGGYVAVELRARRRAA